MFLTNNDFIMKIQHDVIGELARMGITNKPNLSYCQSILSALLIVQKQLSLGSMCDIVLYEGEAVLLHAPWTTWFIIKNE